MALPPTSPEEVLIAEAAEETLERIRRHRRNVRAQVKPLLEKIEERLLDAELTVEALRRWCEVNDKNVSTLFAQDLGLAPWDYITVRRMEVADRSPSPHPKRWLPIRRPQRSASQVPRWPRRRSSSTSSPR